MDVPFDSLDKCSRCDPVEFSQIFIKHNFLSTDEEDFALNDLLRYNPLLSLL